MFQITNTVLPLIQTQCFNWHTDGKSIGMNTLVEGCKLEVEVTHQTTKYNTMRDYTKSQNVQANSCDIGPDSGLIRLHGHGSEYG